jgi:hypothetical protein
MEEAGQSPGYFLDRHIQGDWGEVCEEDKRVNDQALATGVGDVLGSQLLGRHLLIRLEGCPRRQTRRSQLVEDRDVSLLRRE